MLETLKEYAWERLVESGEAESMTRRHALYFAEFAETFMRESNGTRQPEFLNNTDKEHDNLRTALRWAIDHGEGEIALRIAGSLGIFWERRGYLTEGRRWLGQALALGSGDNPATRATALYSSGILALRQRDHIEADRLLQESRALYQATGNKEGQSNALSALAVMIADSDYEQAVQLHTESLELRRQIGDKAGIARTSQNLGHVKMQQAQWEEAYALTQEAHAIYLEMDSPAIAYTSYVLAMIAWGQADTQAALERFEECLEVCRKTHNGWLTAWALHGLSELLYVRQQYDESNRALDEAQGMFAELGDKLGVANALVGRGRAAYRILDYVQANRLYREALELGRQLDNHSIIGSCLAGFAGLAGANGDLRKAALLFGCAEALLLSQSTSLERSTLTLNMVEVRSRLNAEEPGAWDRLWEEGMATEWQRALEIALKT
jgi:tetratricopeptide (TPR) repeat protein